MPLQDIAPGIGVILHHSFVDLVEREVELAKLGWIDHDLILFDEPAHPVYIDHTRDTLQLGAQHPFLQCALIGQLRLVDHRIGRGMRPCAELPVLSLLRG